MIDECVSHLASPSLRPRVALGHLVVGVEPLVHLKEVDIGVK